MLKNKIFFACFCVLTLSFSSFAQYKVRNFFSLSGKKDVAFNCIVQDKLGYLWLGTNEGLLRFDGKKTKIYRAQEGLSDIKITAVYADNLNTIWIGTETGKVFFIKNNKSIDSVNFQKNKPGSKITSFFSNEKIFIGTYGDGLYLLKDKIIEHYTTNNGLSDNVIYNLHLFNNELWCGTDAGITIVSALNTKPQFKTLSNKNGLPDNIVRNLSSYYNNKLIISMQDSGVCFYDLKSNTFEQSTFFKNWTKGAVLNTLAIDTGNFVIATERNGLFFIDKGHFHTHDYNSMFQSASATFLLKDNSDDFWISSPKGLHQFYKQRFDFINSSKGLVNEKVLAIVADNDKSIWIGTEDGVQKMVLDQDGKYVFNTYQPLLKQTISCAAKSPDGNIWFGTYSNGITIVNPNINKIKIINSKTSKLTNDNISTLFFTNKNTVLISTIGGGLIEADINCEDGLKIKNLFTEENGLGSNYVYAAITDNKGNLFAADDGGGLQVFENGKFLSLTAKFKLNSNTVYSLTKDNKGNIWAVSNANGILFYDGKNLIPITQKNGIRDEQPQQIIFYEGILFAIHPKGIDKINCETKTISCYDVSESDLEPNLNSVYIYDGVLYSGTASGILQYRVAALQSDSIKPKAIITHLQINYKTFPLDSLNEFKHNQNNISFGFEGIWLNNPGKISYRYKLKNFEENWLYSNEGKLINYNNLSPGEYTFIVQSKNEEDVWSTEAFYSFTVLSPIWQRWWFWLIVVVVVGSGLYLFFKARLKALHRENALLETKVKERTQEIEKQSKIIEQANKELEQLSLVASKTDNVVLILDAKGRMEYVNESFVKLNRVSLEELKKQGETIYEISNNPNIRNYIEDAVKNKHSVKYESLNKIDELKQVWEASTLTPLFDDNGELKKIIIIDSDVTESKKQEQIIVQKNKDIMDSIEYARKIQTAILPPEALIKKNLQHSFVLYQTKDIVSGDFYWFAEKESFSIIAAVDCTGHGVPGAFMSLIGYNQLNKIVNEQNISDPGQILSELNKGVLDALYKNQKEASKDGMDLAICKIYHDNKTVEFAGSMRPLWIINKNELNETKGDKIPIGTMPEDGNDICYNTHSVKVKKGDVFYIFTDGYADQFGGPKGKKLTTSRFKDILLKNYSLPFNEQHDLLIKEHCQWKCDNEQVDDILVIGFGF